MKVILLVLSVFGYNQTPPKSIQVKRQGSVTIVNGQKKVCSICGKSACFVRIVNGKTEIYCLKHMPRK